MPRPRLILATVAVAGVGAAALVPAAGVDRPARPTVTTTTGAPPVAAAPATATTATYAGEDPSRWGARRLAAQLVFSCADLGHLDRARRQAAAGIGGIALLGRPSGQLAAGLADVRRAARTPVRPLLASDEEGGTVQRLRTAIYPLPTARTMGRWRPARVRRTAYDYAVRMRRLGVRMDLAPVADLAVPGRYIDSLARAFSADPDVVTSHVRAWRRGMRDAGVVTVLKHWPGHGSARDTHTGPGRVPALAQLEGADLLPFDRELAAGAPVVMVGHLLSRGLTTGGVPASESPRALRYLRRSAGPDTLILTDSLAMAAASTSLGISPAQATVRALRAGADWAMACDAGPLRAVAAVRRALVDGRLPRAQAERSARRILALKARFGLAPRR